MISDSSIHNYKLVNLISALDTPKYKDLLKYLKARRSKYTEQHLSILKYFRLKCGQGDYPKEPLNQIAKQCFPNRDITNLELRQWMSGLYLFIKKRLEALQMERHPRLQEYLFVDALLDMGALDLSQHYLDKTAQRWSPSASSDPFFEYKLSDLHYELISLSSRKLDQPLRRSLDYLHISTLEAYLKQYCRVLSFSKLSSQHQDSAALLHLINLLRKEVDPNLEVINRWDLSVSIIRDDETTAFGQLKKIIGQTVAERATYPDMRMQYFICINFAIRQANQGQRPFVQEAFDLYKLGLETKLIYRGDYLTKFTYRNIINHGLALNNYEWVRSFMDKYKNALNPHEQQNTYVYNLARYHFYLQEYEKALSFLREAEFNDVAYNLDARRMILRIYFAQEEWITLDYFLDSFRAYILRKTSSSKVAKSYAPLVKYSKSFMRNRNKPQRLKMLLERVSSESIFVDKTWLVNQIERLTVCN